MRTSSNPLQTVPPMPFAGLGLSAATVRAAAETMRPVYCGENRGVGPMLPRPVPGRVRRWSGYPLLVALGREIRGR